MPKTKKVICYWLAISTIFTGFVQASPSPLLGIPILPDPVELAVANLIQISTNPNALNALHLSVATGPNTGITCPLLPAILPDPKDCTGIYVCTLAQIRLKLKCNDGYHYNPGNLLVFCVPDSPTDNCCRTITDPGNCTTSSHGCSFCLTRPYNHPRCDHYTNLVSDGCPKAEIYNKTSGSGENRVIGPDVTETEPVDIALMPGDKKNFTITVELEPYPFDLYFLLDVTASMADDKASVASLSSALVGAIGNFTPDFTLGFGTFTDKYDASVIDYHHILNLSNDTSTFSSTVQNTPGYGGVDLPEDSGTAMIEAAVCKSQVGWRTNTRKMMLVVTDAIFHTAHDGTSLTQNRPAFDGACHLDANGLFSARSVYDYPSIDQVVSILNDNKITMVFAAAGTAIQAFYQGVANQLIPVGRVGALSTDGGNIVDLFKAAYLSAASNIALLNTPPTSEVQITYYSNCNPDGSTTNQDETTVCTGLPVSGEVVFTIEVELNTCPANATDYQQTVQITAAGIPRNIEVPLHLVCGY